MRVPSPPAGQAVRAEVAVTTLVDPFLVAPGQPVRYELPASAGPVDVAADGSAELQAAPARRSRTRPRASSATRRRVRCERCPPRIPLTSQVSSRSPASCFRPSAQPGASSGWRSSSASAGATPRGAPGGRPLPGPARVTRGAASPYQAIVALEAWLRTTRAYDDQASLPETPDALARWAAAGTAGYCQMFAASLAALARLSGVPARVAEGFAPGTLRDGAYHVTDRDAHAWVEAWFPGYGWLPFDATPGRALPERASSSSPSFDGAAAQAPPSGGGRAGSLPRLRLPLSRLGAAGVRSDRGAHAGAAWWHGRRAHRPRTAGAARGRHPSRQARAAAARPPRRSGTRRPPDDLVFAADQGVELGSALTPRELARALERQFGVDGGAFATALERAAYGPPGAGDEAGLEQETARLLRALRASLGRARRLRGVFSARALSAARARAR